MIGRTLSHYKITKLLGAGGMGEVYWAQDTTLGRTVALKILPAEVSSDAHRLRRFKHEAKAASLLSHPNVSQIYEIGEADGIHFIVMEYIEGQTLQAKIQEHPLETADIVNWAIQIADALDEAHEKGIIHRDLKAANILITPRRQAKVLDFGLAKMTNPGVVGGGLITPPLTEAGMMIGTVHYMSPEQAMGKKVDHRSDIFSLGVLLYQMATGRLPFGGESTAEILSHLLNQQPDAIARLNYNVPADLERIIRKALEKDPERRYQSAHDLLIDLKNLKRDTESGAVPAVAKPVSMPRLRNLLAVLMLVLLIAGGFVIYRYANRGPAIHSIAVLPFVNAGADPNMDYLSDGITDTTINSLSQLHDLRVMARTTVFAYKGKQVDPRKAGQDLKVDALVTGSILQQGDTLTIQAELVKTSDGSQIWGQRYQRRMTEIISMQSDLSREISESLRLRLSGEEQERVTKQYTNDPEAYQLYLKGVFFTNEGSEESATKAIDFLHRAIEKDPNYALAYSQLSTTYSVLAGNGWSQPGEVLLKAKSAAVKALQLDETLGEAHISLGFVALLHDWNWAQVEKETTRGIELSPKYAKGHSIRAQYLSAMGRHIDALDEARKSVDLEPFNALIKVTAAWLYYNAGRYDESIKSCNSIIEADPGFWLAYEQRGECYLEKGMPSQAVDDFQKAADLSSRDPLVLADLAWANVALGKTAEARRLSSELMDQAAKRYVPPTYIAVTFAALGDNDTAFEWLEKGYAQRDVWVVFLVDPWWDPIRSDPRFTDLQRRMKLLQ